MLADRIRKTLGDLALRIDHIGSTSVSGLAAKDVVDIQVTVQELSTVIIDCMARGSFRSYSTFNSDHIPPGEIEDPREWQKLLFVEPAGERRANIHVRRNGSRNQRYAILFRDYLRSHPQAANAYSELKRRLASGLADPSTYPEVKDPAVDLIYIAAEAWARQTNWRGNEVV